MIANDFESSGSILEVWTRIFLTRTLLVLVEAKWRIGKHEDSKDKFF